ncbi:MAG: hypothetical protein VB835_19940, partial [Pirellulales bacterium]
ARLARLRWLIRGYVFAEGFGAVVCCLAICFWVSLVIDYGIESTPATRLGIVACLGLLTIYVLYRRMIRRLFVPLPDKSMAVLMERRNRVLDDRLLTVVELAGRQSFRAGYDPRMLASTHEEVSALVDSANLTRIFRPAPLGNVTIAAALLVGTVAVFAAGKTELFAIWANRSLMMGDRDWPRQTKIFVEGFEEVDGQRLVKVARGSDFEVRAGADALFAIPDSIEIQYETAEASGEPNMTKLGRAGGKKYQFYKYEFKNVQTDIQFDVVARRGHFLEKNGRVNELRILAVEGPDLAEIQLVCTYPEYLGLAEETIAVNVVKPLPEGTTVKVLAEANKELLAASYRMAANDPQAPWEEVEINPSARKHIEVALRELSADTRVEFKLRDVDNVTNQQPIRLLLRVVPDETPRVDVRLVGIGRAVTPKAALPVRGSIWDDHKISSAWFEYRVGQGDPDSLRFEVPENGELDDEVDMVFRLEELGLAPGQQLSVLVKAQDNYALADSAHVGLGQHIDLPIVSEAELRAALETRERLLRRRFQSVIDEMQRSRDALARMSGQAADSASPEKADNSQPDEADESGTGSDKPSPSARQATIRVLRTEEAIQTSSRMAHETRAIADEFDRILLELEINNVSFIEEYEERIGVRISAPLRSLADQEFPKLDDRLAQMRRVLDDEAKRNVALVVSRREIDAILAEMDQILKNMLELREFNELLANLRKIIDGHKQVSQLTETERERIKKLLREELKKGLLE